ncbi:MAG: hypothetical protein HOC74_00395 [Gemmatimonadetes bacterium]|nr:hypothetical protein [Gemmatimonadota bacterium]
MSTTSVEMPCIPFGSHNLSRLMMGSNPINAGSHLSRFVNEQMKRYFTQERVLAMLSQCEELEINTWQSGPGNLDLYRAFSEGGGQMHYISLAQENERNPDMLERVVEAGAIGVAHHGEVTDVFWHNGEIDRAREYCRKIRDTGVMVGVSTHIPAVVEYIVENDWDVDFFMCCVYERHRSRDKLRELLGDVPIPVREVYLEGDPPRMYAAMRGTDKPCLAFKILAAGRLCDRQEWVEQAFEATFRQMKDNDAVIVGMYPEYEDQVGINAEYVRRFSGLSQTLAQVGAAAASVGCG